MHNIGKVLLTKLKQQDNPCATPADVLPHNWCGRLTASRAGRGKGPWEGGHRGSQAGRGAWCSQDRTLPSWGAHYII